MTCGTLLNVHLHGEASPYPHSECVIILCLSFKALMFTVIGGLGPDASRGCPAEWALLPEAGIRESQGQHCVEGRTVAGAKGPHCRATLDIQCSIGLCVYHAGFLGTQGKYGAVQVFLIYRANAGVLAALEPAASSGPDCHCPVLP